MEFDDFIETIMLSQSGLQWAKSFRRSRIRFLTSEQTPIPLSDGCAFFLHIVPYGNRVSINFRDDKYYEVIKRHGFSKVSSNYVFNCDGWMWYTSHDSKKISSYSLYMRAGIIEQCNIYPPFNNGNFIPGQSMNEFLLFNIVDNLEALSDMGQDFPMAVFVSILNAKGWSIGGLHTPPYIDRNEIWIEECDLKCKPNEYEKDLEPLIDAVWNCGGLASSPYSIARK